jgi:hypothetical protein
MLLKKEIRFQSNANLKELGSMEISVLSKTLNYLPPKGFGLASLYLI